jgi:hypothetical protein
MICLCRRLTDRNWINPPLRIPTSGVPVTPRARVLVVTVVAAPSVRARSPLSVRYQKVPVAGSSSRWSATDTLSPVASTVSRAPEGEKTA